MVLHAAQMRDRGACALEVVKWVEENRLNMCHFLSVDDLNFLKRGGRLPPMAQRSAPFWTSSRCCILTGKGA